VAEFVLARQECGLRRRRVPVMTRMGLWSFGCLVPAETLDHGHRDAWTEDEMDQLPGTSYGNIEATSNFAYTDNGRKGKGEFEGARGRDRSSVNCASGGAHMLSCFRAGAINLVRSPRFILAAVFQVYALGYLGIVVLAWT